MKHALVFILAVFAFVTTAQAQVSIGAAGTADTHVKLTVNGNTGTLPANPNTVGEQWMYQIGLANGIAGGMGIQVAGTGNTAAFGVFDFMRANGTMQAPTALASGDLIGVIGAFGAIDSSGDYSAGAAQIRWVAQPTGSNWSSSDQGAVVNILATPAGSPALGHIKQVASFAANSASAVSVNVGVSGTTGGIVSLAGSTFANLPASPTAGMQAYITDVSTCSPDCTTWGASITAGNGSTSRLAWYNGTNWTLIGK
jgi:hypothetical protein